MQPLFTKSKLGDMVCRKCEYYDHKHDFYAKSDGTMIVQCPIMDYNVEGLRTTVVVEKEE